MKKGERFIICRAQRHGSRGSDGHRKSMSDMTFACISYCIIVFPSMPKGDIVD
jgi:hypothetical protein